VSAVVLVTGVGVAAGARAAAAAIACAGTEPDRAALLVDLDRGRAPRPALIASAAARELEERLVAHLPQADAASRGRICHLALAPDASGLEAIGAALAIGRGSTVSVHLAPDLVQTALDGGLRPTGAVLRADLAEDRALTALAVGDLLDRGIRVAVLKRSLGWIAARAALAGIPVAVGDGGLPARIGERVLRRDAAPSVFHPDLTAEECG
jgi:hypothetical protein